MSGVHQVGTGGRERRIDLQRALERVQRRRVVAQHPVGQAEIVPGLAARCPKR